MSGNRSHFAAVAAVVQLALLSAVLRLTEPTAGLIDFWFSGSIGVDAQAAVGLGATMMTAAAWLTGPLLFAQTTAVSGLHAAGRHDEVRQEIRVALISAVKIGLGLCAVMLIISFSAPLPAWTSSYLMIRAMAIPFTAVSMAIWGSFRGLGKTWLAAALALMATLIHAVLAASLIAPLGIIGLGVAGVLSHVVAAIISVWLARRLRLLNWLPVSRNSEWASGSAHILLMVRSCSLGAATMLMAFSASSTGSVDGAAYQLTYQIWIILIMVADGWRAAGQVLLARNSDTRAQKNATKLLLGVSILLGTVLATLFLTALPIAQTVLAGTSSVATALSSLWPWAGLAVWCAAIALALDGLEYGKGQFARNLWQTLVGTGFWVIGAFVCFITGIVELLWIGVAAGFTVRILINLIASDFRRP